MIRLRRAPETFVRRAGAKVSIRQITKYYGVAQPAVEDVSLEIDSGEFVTLLGASGSGKTTTLMIVAGFTAPTSGDVLLDGQSIVGLPPEKRGIGVVFQNYALFPHMTAVKNAAFPLRMRGIGRGEALLSAEAALHRVGLEGLGSRLPAQLSGGQQQRVALARALVFEPGLLLMDEPLGALDRALREQMKTEIRRLHKDLGVTVVYVTHDQEEALTLSDRIALMNRGKIIQIGSPSDLYERPSNAFVAGFIGEGSLIEGKVVRKSTGLSRLAPDTGGPPFDVRGSTMPEGSRAFLFIRPEKVVVTTEARDRSDAHGAEVIDALYVGDITRLTLRLEHGQTLTAKHVNRSGVPALCAGTTVRVSFSPEDAILLPISCAPEETIDA
jgi:spermidine/putrescine ABC transporter ATP-binding subunit